MGDLDCLICEEDRGRAHELMTDLGYSCSADQGNVWVYQKGMVVIEMHSRIAGNNISNGVDYMQFFSDAVNQIAEEDEELCLKREYHFCFLIYHIAKHISSTGAGVRMFMDLVIFLKHYGMTFDKEKAERMLKEASLDKVAVTIENLCDRWFEIEGIPWVELSGAFLNPVQALEFIENHSVEAAFLDIEMPEMNGLELAEKLRELSPGLVIIFITGYEQYTLDALKIKADYYLTKPYDNEDIKEVLERARLLSARQKKRVYIRTFPRFEVFVADSTVYFPNSKAKELLALCVDHCGGIVTIEEAVDKLWEGRKYDARVKNLYRKAVMQVRQVLAAQGVEEIFNGNRGSCQIDIKKIDCDYYDFLKGIPEAVQKWKLGRKYLEEYSWAEETAANIELSVTGKHFRDSE